MRRLFFCAVSAASAAMTFGSALAGPDWIEGDAGSLPPGAETVAGAGPLDTIAGTLGPGDEEDMYKIYISDPVGFSARTTTMVFRGATGGAAGFDSQLFLFDASGHGLLANNDHLDEPPGSRLLPFSTDGTSQIIPGPGEYFLAISPFGRLPVSAGGPIFNFQTPTEVSGPDGPGGALPIANWIGSGDTGEGTYIIRLHGAERIPAPGTGLAGVLLGVVAGGRRRRAP